MKREEIMRLSGMPAAAPSYPKGPYRFVNREYFIVTYESDPEAIRHALPEPLEVPRRVILLLMNTSKCPDSSGFLVTIRKAALLSRAYLKGKR